MNVILLEKVGRLGSVGDVANVKAGYARNYLFPYGIAVPATKANLADFESRKAELLAAHNEKLAAAQARASRINGLQLIIEVNAGDEGRLFGSVGTKDIAEAINAKGGETSKREVQLPHGVIREVGVYEVTIDLGYDVLAVVTLNVQPIKSSGEVPNVSADDASQSGE